VCASVSSVILSCSSDNSANLNRTVKLLASNVIYSTANANNSITKSADIDTTTKVLAENVLYDGDNSTLAVDNVQDALDQLSLNFAKTIIGNWNIENKLQEEEMHSSTGTITISPDGVFNLTSGSFAAIGMGSGFGPQEFCKHEEDGQLYEFITDKIVVFKHVNGGVLNQVIPQLIELEQDRITFIGSGGCGMSGWQRVSILTRVQ